MAGIYTRNEVDKIIRNPELTEEQKTEAIFALHGRDLDAGYVSKRAAEEMRTQAVEAAKAEFKVPEPVDPTTTPEYMAVVKERDMLRTFGSDDFSVVKPKFREQVYGMIDRGENAPAIADQLAGIREKYEECFFPAAEEKKEPEQKDSPVYSKEAGRSDTNPPSEEDKIFNALKDSWK